MPGAFFTAIMIAGLFGLALGESCMMLTAVVLMLNWLLCVLLTLAGDGAGLEWFGLGVIDFSSALLIIVFGNRDWQYGIVAVFVAMIGCHLLRFAIPSTFTDHNYLLSLCVLSWTQLAMVMGRGGYVIYRRAKGGLSVRGGVRPSILSRDEDRRSS